MKNKIAIMLCAATLGLFVRCSGDHASSPGKDTAANTYKVAPNTDTANASGASSADNSAAGGTKIDTSRQKMKMDTTKK